MTPSTLLLFVALATGGVAAPDAQELLATVRGLYAEAAYEEVLAALEGAEPAEPAAVLEVERYRALCLFALGQRDAARNALARIVERDPLYVATEADVPPRMVSMLHEVRRELLPGIARRAYADVRDQLAGGKATDAAPTLERIVRMTSDPDVNGVEGMEDLRLLADGFLTLAKAAQPAKPSTSAQSETGIPATPVGTNGSPGSAGPPPPPPIFTAADTDVVQPQPIEQDMPPWSVNRGPRTGMTFSGYLRIVISEDGTVDSANLVRPIHPAYDTDLLRAARYWRFTPAQKDGKPVRFLKIVRISIKDM
jgi:TonB family protein